MADSKEVRIPIDGGPLDGAWFTDPKRLEFFHVAQATETKAHITYYEQVAVEVGGVRSLRYRVSSVERDDICDLHSDTQEMLEKLREEAQ